MKYFFILVSLFTSLSAFSLEYNDTIKKVSVIKHYANNTVVLNRGLEDGIDQYDHIKLTNRNGYIARAVCTRVTMLLSYWKVYRVVNPELLSYDSNYVLRSMMQSSLPPHIRQFVRMKKNQGEIDIEELGDDQIQDKHLKKAVDLQQDRIVKFDLANDMAKDEVVLKENITESDEFIERNFDSKKLSSDLSSFRLTLFTSPVSWESQNDEKSVDYGFALGNKGEKYQFDLNYNRRESKVVNQFTEEEVTSDYTNTLFTFGIKDIAEDFSYFAMMNYVQYKEGNRNYPLNRTQTGILGFRYNVFEDESITRFDISYITLSESLKTDILDKSDPTKTDTLSENNARHAFRVRFNSNLSEKMKFSSLFWYRPLIDLSKQEVIWEDNLTEWTNSISYNFTEKFSLSYQYQYTEDIRRKNDFNLNPINQINTVNLNYAIEI